MGMLLNERNIRNVADRVADFFSKNGNPLSKDQAILTESALFDILLSNAPSKDSAPRLI